MHNANGKWQGSTELPTRKADKVIECDVRREFIQIPGIKRDTDTEVRGAQDSSLFEIRLLIVKSYDEDYMLKASCVKSHNCRDT